MSLLHLLNLDTIGGVEELFIHFLAHAPIEQHVLITGAKPHPFFKRQLAQAYTLEKYSCGVKLPRFLRALKRKQTLQKIDPDKIVLWNRIEAIDKHSAKIVYYEHGASWILRKQPTSFFREIDQLLVNSYAAKRVLELKWDVQMPATIVHNPLKPTLAPAHGPKKAPDPAMLTLGYLGRLIPLKGVALLLHAVHKLHKQIPVRLLIAGDGPSKESLQKETRRLNLEKQVSFLGCIEDITTFYDAIDLLIIPSIREPLGLVAQEAELRACPVIASFVDGLAEVVINEKTGYTIPQTLNITHYKEFGGQMDALPDLVYDPGLDTLREPKLIDPEALADQILALVQNPERYTSFSSEALAFAKQRPSFAAYTKQLLQLLQK